MFISNFSYSFLVVENLQYNIQLNANASDDEQFTDAGMCASWKEQLRRNIGQTKAMYEE